MSDKLTIGKITFASPSVSIKQRKVRLLKKGTPAFDAVDAIKRHEEALLKLLAVKHPRLLRALAEKSFDTASESP